MKRTIAFVSPLILIACLLASCRSEPAATENELPVGDPNVIIHELSEPGMLNPVNYVDGHAGAIMANMYHQLLGIDQQTLELTPVLAEARPVITKKDSGLLLTFRIRDEAVWDNGTPITAKDVAFTLKVMKAPGVNNQTRRSSYESIKDIFFDPQDPRKFTLWLDQQYVLAEAASGGFFIIPSHVYDPMGRLNKYTLHELATRPEGFEKDTVLIAFAEEFNSEKYQRNPAFISGSGPYELVSWKSNQEIVLRKKENWWGSKVVPAVNDLTANPPQLTYQIINDQSTALTALKAGEHDVNYSMRAKDFAELQKSERFLEKYNLHTPVALEYHYIGLNLKHPILREREVRQAIAHLMNVPQIIDAVQYGFATQVTGPVHYTKKSEYNDTIKPYQYSPETATQLLEAAGWTDSDGDGIRDKVIRGRRTPLSLTYIYNSGNDERRAVGLLLQEEARKVGMQIEVRDQEWGTYLQNLSTHQFDLFFLAASMTPVPMDYKQQFHTTQQQMGSNYSNFGDASTDSLIDAIRVELDEAKRADMSRRMQAILHRELPMIFLFSRHSKIAISNRFENTGVTVVRPGYREAGFILHKGPLR